MLSRSQTWFPTCRTFRDSSNLVAARKPARDSGRRPAP